MATILLVAGPGVCMFGLAHDTNVHGMSPDLCGALLAFSLAIPLVVGPGVNGWYRPVLVRSACVTRVRSLDPPPKSPSLA